MEHKRHTERPDAAGKNKRGHLFVLGIVFITALFLRIQGIAWPQFHPDEPRIAAWLEWTRSHTHVEDQLYASGFFALIRPFDIALRSFDWLSGQMRALEGVSGRFIVEPSDPIMIARWFNVWLGALTCLLIYLLTRRVTASRWSAVFAAALMACAQFPLEHAHYGETDIAMVFSLTAAMWLTALAADKKSIPLLFVAALASGFALGTKFNLVMVLIPVACYSFLFTGWQPTRRGLITSLIVLLASAVFIAAGFAIANPSVLDWHWFRTELAAEARRVYTEPGALTGTLKWRVHSLELLDNFSTLGQGWVVLILLGIPLAFLREYRRFIPLALVMPAVYTYYWIFAAPWVRDQEFMNFLPAFALLAGIALAATWRTAKQYAQLAALVFAASALTLTAINGMKVLSVFTWKDTRVLAFEWMQKRLPTNVTIATERYSEPALPTARAGSVWTHKIEYEGLPWVREAGAGYLLRSATLHGRKIRDPITKLRFPEYEAKYNEFIRNSELLVSFASKPPQGFATFVSPTIELYGLQHFSPSNMINIDLPQPFSGDRPILTQHRTFFRDVEGRFLGIKPARLEYVVAREEARASGKTTYHPVGHRFSGATSIELDRKSSTAAIAGPDRGPDAVYVVLNTGDSAANVRIQGLGRDLMSILGPYDMSVLKLTRTGLRPDTDLFDKISGFTETDDRHLNPTCTMRIAFTAGEAARMCAGMSRYDLITALIPRLDTPCDLDPALRFIHAVKIGRTDLASTLRPAAEKMLETIRRCRDAAPEDSMLNGNSAYYFDQLARLRLPYEWSCTPEPLNGNPTSGVFLATCDIPLSAASGIYELSAEVRVRPSGDSNETGHVLEFFAGTDESRRERVTLTHGKWSRVTISMPFTTPKEPELSIIANQADDIFLRKVELRWSTKSAMQDRAVELQSALAEHDIQLGKTGDALKRINQTLETGNCWNILELRRLRLEALTAAPATNAQLRLAALELMDSAPNNYACLKTLEAVTGQPLTKASEGNIVMPISFARFLKIVGFHFNATSREIRCVMEATEDDVPPVSAAVRVMKGNKWRTKQLMPVNDRISLSKGERVICKATLDQSLGSPLDMHNLAIGIQTSPASSVGSIPLARDVETSVPFEVMLKLASSK